MMRRLFIVRHGNTFAPGESPRRIGSRTDLPLVESGHVQAAALGKWFAELGIEFELALSGPLLRTRQTAEAILSASAQPCPLEISDFLVEIDHGPDENSLEEDVIARVGHDAIKIWDNQGQAPDGWVVDHDRRLAAWRAFLTDAPTGNMLLVTSNGAARFALLAIGVYPGNHSLKLRTGAYGEIVQNGPQDFVFVNWDQRPE